MSIKTWLAEFYHIPANALRFTWIQAIDHSLTKWRGLRSAALKKHKCRVDTDGVAAFVTDARRLDELYIDNMSCALCIKADIRCSICPLGRINQDCISDNSSPFKTFIDTRNPEPMIRALYKARRYMLARRSHKCKTKKTMPSATPKSK